MQELNNQNLFADPSELEGCGKENAVNAANVERKELTASVPNYNVGSVDDGSVIDVRFCTGGRLSAPPVLRFRDYTLQASQVLAEYSGVLDPEDDDPPYYPVIEKILNSMVVDNFDCGLLHIEEAKEVLLNVHGKWWGSTLKDFKYFINPDIEDEAKLTAAENISLADIPLSSIKIDPLADGIKEPININIHGTVVKFIYPRLRNIGIIDNMMKTKFAVEEQKFFKIKEILKFNRKHENDPDKKITVNVEEARAYDDYLTERGKWRIIFSNAQLICGVDNDVFNTFEERVNAIVQDKRILARHWQAYWKFLDGKGKFGVRNEAEFYSDILDQKVTRPFLIRAVSLMPWDAMVSDGDESTKIYFG